MTLAAWARRLAPDRYVLAILGMVLLATLAPARGDAAHIVNLSTKLAIALLFFMHGARLSREAVIAGMTHWRLHLLILGATFGAFPVMGVVLRGLTATFLNPALGAGVVFLCCLPSTVQSSIAFTSMAKGNVAAAVCAASASNLLGIIMSPILATALLGVRGGAGGGDVLGAVGAVAVQLLLPFVAGQLARPLLLAWITRHARLIGYTDRGSILLVVYGAFSAAVVEGLWNTVSALELVYLFLVCAVLLAIMLAVTVGLARIGRLSRSDEIAVVFCGSKKSLASGVPMAGVMFPPAAVGMMVLPLMIFHQLQLMACAIIAQEWSRDPDLP